MTSRIENDSLAVSCDACGWRGVLGDTYKRRCPSCEFSFHRRPNAVTIDTPMSISDDLVADPVDALTQGGQ